MKKNAADAAKPAKIKGRPCRVCGEATWMGAGQWSNANARRNKSCRVKGVPLVPVIHKAFDADVFHLEATELHEVAGPGGLDSVRLAGIMSVSDGTY